VENLNFTGLALSEAESEVFVLSVGHAMRVLGRPNV
jgi:hypothetical protein